MGLWESINSHARLITNYSMEKEFLQIAGDEELLTHIQLISAHAKHNKRYEETAKRNINLMIDKKTMKTRFKIKKS